MIPNWYTESKDDKVYNSEFRKLREQYDKILLYSGNMGQLQDMDTIIDYLKLNKENNNTLTILCGHGKEIPICETSNRSK